MKRGKSNRAALDTEDFRRPPTAQQAVLLQLRRWLLSGRLSPGDQIVQEALADDLGLSIVPVREALKTLESEGQVIYRPHRGFFVTELSLEELLEICDIRSRLEGMAVERGLEHVTDEDLRAMKEVLEQMAAAAEEASVVELTRLDREFHFTVYRRAGMPRLLRLISLLWDQSDPYRAMFFSDERHRRTDHDHHEQILAATASGDVQTLVRLLDEHRLRPVHELDHLLMTEPTRR